MVLLHGFSLSLGELLFLEVMRRYALACVLCFNSEHFFVNNLTALFYNSIILFTLVVTVYEGRCWPINKYFDLVSCSADERVADGMEAMLTRKGESVELGECKRWFWNNSPFFGFSINVIADFERNYVNPLFKTKVKKLYCIYSFTDYIV